MPSSPKTKRAKAARAKPKGRATPRKRTNPSAIADRKALAAARRLSQQFHGTPGEVVELSARERKPLPRYVVSVGELKEFTYEPEPGSKRARFAWRHESGDRGLGQPKADAKPLVVVDPKTRRPAIVPHRSPMKLDGRRGFVG